MKSILLGTYLEPIFPGEIFYDTTYRGYISYCCLERFFENNIIIKGIATTLKDVFVNSRNIVIDLEQDKIVKYYDYTLYTDSYGRIIYPGDKLIRKYSYNTNPDHMMIYIKQNITDFKEEYAIIASVDHTDTQDHMIVTKQQFLDSVWIKPICPTN